MRLWRHFDLFRNEPFAYKQSCLDLEDKRGGLVDMVPIHDRPDIPGRELPGGREGDLTEGAGNASAAGTLVECKSRLRSW